MFNYSVYKKRICISCSFRINIPADVWFYNNCLPFLTNLLIPPKAFIASSNISSGSPPLIAAKSYLSEKGKNVDGKMFE